MDQKLRERLDKGIALREEGRAKEDMSILNEACTLLMKMSEEYPENAEINYQIGIAHDNSGFTKEAITYYVKAIEQGLSGADLERCLLGLGSSYRLTGQYDKAVETLQQGVAEFPEHRGLQIFYSMALYNTGRYNEAMEIALMNLMETTNDEKLQYFKRGITYYAQHLDETW
ncbi:tetratricopeptide repeat protein [Fictibacillus sp. BK138]|uniref:tetratricopeptide repeat protein n=1 Tax=Fictibacillus sp. BK138 TaxID=2512121 RepID=UPI001029BEEE|nr:tetratricopeptide repeat protein [Fictibacillus sp. BK138]RZT23538.1 tetratricopeptide repeat protein [Fictibacillus sp. BK138]